MLENIHRHIEDGLSPLEAAIKGAGEIGFTIVSISLSLVAVFIPLLLMGGIVGRLFREFAITVTMTIAVSAFVSLTLTPVMAARFLRREKDSAPRPALLRSSEMFDRCWLAIGTASMWRCAIAASRSASSSSTVAFRLSCSS